MNSNVIINNKKITAQQRKLSKDVSFVNAIANYFYMSTSNYNDNWLFGTYILAQFMLVRKS